MRLTRLPTAPHGLLRSSGRAGILDLRSPTWRGRISRSLSICNSRIAVASFTNFGFAPRRTSSLEAPPDRGQVRKETHPNKILTRAVEAIRSLGQDVLLSHEAQPSCVAPPEAGNTVGRGHGSGLGSSQPSCASPGQTGIRDLRFAGLPGWYAGLSFPYARGFHLAEDHQFAWNACWRVAAKCWLVGTGLPPGQNPRLLRLRGEHIKVDTALFGTG
jgi:hypothetical protein